MSCVDYNSIYSDREWYSTEEINALACSPAGGPANPNWNITLVGNDNQDKAMNYFLQRGLSLDQAAAIIGNLIQESGVNPRAVQGGGPGMGLAQWSRGDRWDSAAKNLLGFAAGSYIPGAGGDPYALLTQLNFIWYELNYVPQFKTAFANFKKETSLASMVDVFVHQYEIAGIVGPRFQDALDAKALYIKLHGTGTTGGGGGGGSVDCTSPTGGLGVNGNFTFPEVTTQTALKTHKPTWCYNNTNSCHHDYFAADIFNNEGTVNVAAVGGKVIRAVDYNHACSGGYDVPRVQVQGTDGQYYYYTHMRPGSIKVHDQQVITAGTPLGVIGPTACAEYTPTHLHFQMSSVEITNTSDPVERTKYIDPQPNLIAAFKKLPL